MANPAKKPVVAGAKKPVAEKQKAEAFVNWSIVDENGESVLRSSKGFPIFANEYKTLEEDALVRLAEKHGGSVTVNAQLRIMIRTEKPDQLDISGIAVVTK